MYNKLFVIILAFFCNISNEDTQNSWVLKSNENGIAFYTKKHPVAGTVHLRVVSSTKASLAKCKAIASDVKKQEKWLNSCKKVTILKQANNQETLYQMYFDYPWPLSDRDAVAEGKVIEKDGQVQAHSYSKPTSYPEVKDVVRIKLYELHNYFTPKSDGTVEIDYQLVINPNISMSQSIIERNSAESTITSMKAFKALAEK